MKRYFDILELKPGATPDEVKAAYRDLAKVWHPDRFKSDDGRLKERAAEKLAEINEAYAKIRSYQARQKERIKAINESRARTNSTPNGGESIRMFGERPNQPTGNTAPPPHRPSPSNPSSGGDARTYAGYMRNAQRGNSYHRTSSPHSRSSRSSSPFANGHSSTRRSSSGSSRSYTHRTSKQPTSSRTSVMRHRSFVQRERYGRNGSKKRRKQSRTAIYITVGVLVVLTIVSATFFLQREQSRGELRSILQQQQMGEAPSAGDSNATLEEQTRAMATTPPAQPAPGYWTLGSTRQDVTRVQGEPSQVRDRLYRYGLSSIFFENGRVVGWHQAPKNPLKVQLLPSIPQDVEFFTVGSTRDEVLSVQGTPDQYRDNGIEFKYGESRVMFERGIVTNWQQHKDAPLSARLLPKVKSNIPFFTLGSTKDEVLSVQGSPDYFTETTFHYGYSTVSFDAGKVTGWHEASTFPLLVELYPSTNVSAECFTYNSTRDEVLAVQGTPSQYTERMLKFGYSTVSFDGGRVVSWFESAASSPLKFCRQ